MNKVIMSIDAGGTKTKAALIDYDCNIVFERVGGPGSPAVLKEQKAMKNIMDLIDKVFLEAKDLYEITYIQMGISALSAVEDKSFYEKFLSSKYSVPVSIENDAYMALYSIIQDKYNEGIVVLAGTGSAICGKNAQGVVDLNGGWGHLLTEDGSSYRVVIDLITKMIEDHENEREMRPLGKKLLELLDIPDVTRIRVFVYDSTKTEISKYAQFISEEANKGDRDAINILKKAGIDLANRVRKLARKLGLGGDGRPFGIGYRGSFIQKASFVKESLEEHLEIFNVNFDVLEGKLDPVFGGFYIAKSKGMVK